MSYGQVEFSGDIMASGGGREVPDESVGHPFGGVFDHVTLPSKVSQRIDDHVLVAVGNVASVGGVVVFDELKCKWDIARIVRKITRRLAWRIFFSSL